MSTMPNNFQTGVRFGFYEKGLGELVEEVETLAEHPPRIIHYTSREKPWLNHRPILYAERYWFYYNLTWTELKKPLG